MDPGSSIFAHSEDANESSKAGRESFSSRDNVLQTDNGLGSQRASASIYSDAAQRDVVALSCYHMKLSPKLYLVVSEAKPRAQ